MPVHRARILVVDDDRGILTMLELALANEQYAVATATSREDALAAAHMDPPDAILIDVRLRAEDGISLARELRAACSARLVLMTAGERRRADIGAEPVDAWLLKPFDLAELYGVLERVLGQAAAAR
jgi:DNA-binding response OmpR family regulator